MNLYVYTRLKINEHAQILKKQWVRWLAKTCLFEAHDFAGGNIWKMFYSRNIHLLNIHHKYVSNSWICLSKRKGVISGDNKNKELDSSLRLVFMGSHWTGLYGRDQSGTIYEMCYTSGLDMTFGMISQCFCIVFSRRSKHELKHRKPAFTYKIKTYRKTCTQIKKQFHLLSLCRAS